MKAHRIALAFHGEPQHKTRQLIGPHRRVARRLKRKPGFVEGGLQYRKRLRVEGTGMKPAHHHASQRSTVIDITDLAEAWDKVGRVCDGGAHLRDTGSSWHSWNATSAASMMPLPAACKGVMISPKTSALRIIAMSG